MILLHSITVAFMILGMYIACTWEGMIFAGLCNQLRFILPDYIKKPLFDCPYCMSSFYTLTYCVLTSDITWLILIKIPCTCGMIALLMPLLNKLMSYEPQS